VVPPDSAAGRGTGGRAGEGSLRIAVQHFHDVGVYAVNDEGRIAEVNRRAESLLARPAEELVGQNAHDLLHRSPSGQPLPRSRCSMLKAFLAGRTDQGTRTWHLRGDGFLVPMSWLVTPYPVDSGANGALMFFHETPQDAAEGESPESPRDQHALSDLDRLALLAETTTQLTATLEAEETLQRLVRLVVPRLADWAVVDLITETDEVWRSVVVHADGERVTRREDLQGPMPPVPTESPMPLSRALRGAASTLTGPDAYQGLPDSGIAVAQAELFQVTGMHSAAIAPIRGVREVLGALTLGRSERAEAFDDLSLLEDIARRLGLALDNVRLYQGQRRVAETMQRHLLPQMPSLPRMQMTARYVPATDAAEVGGDWYDAFGLPDGATALAIGDVVGHDLDAAAAMAQVRNMLRAYAWSYREPPSVIVDRLDQAAEHMTEASMATIIFARLEEDHGRWRIKWTNAGHPPPLLVTRDGQARFLEADTGADPLIGTGVRQPRHDTAGSLPPMATLLFYTDGLIESSGRSLDDGLRRLRGHAAALAHRPLDSFCNALLERVRPEDNEDDVALLVLRTPGVQGAGPVGADGPDSTSEDAAARTGVPDAQRGERHTVPRGATT
jgi:serine phosphatase RsbU (regulator of sigma subunit)